MLTIIDYKMINLGSILNMLKKVGVKELVVASSTKEILAASKIIMPGVGSFDQAIQRINSLKILEVLKEKALIEQIPFLGICLGMQLMTNSSEEGELPGLGLIDAHVKKFSFSKDNNFKIPHMGWNQVYISKKTKLFNDEDIKRFYFVHSYYVECNNKSDIFLTTKHGNDFTSGFEHKNLIGVQFHPEKSHIYGFNLFKNFVENY
jgi:glutamine amidotransferase